jgi:hypothetical protein
MQDNTIRPFLPVIILFIVLNGFFISGKSLLEKWHTDQSVLIIGNLVLFGVTLSSYILSQRGLRSGNPHAFIRSMYGSFMIKLFVCVIAAFLYIISFKKNVNKPALFACMGLYMIYSFIEVSLLTKMMKKKKDA